MSACPDVMPLLTAYREETLTTANAERVRAHVAACPACRERLAALETAYASLRDLPTWPAGDPAVLAERARVRGQRRSPASTPVQHFWRPALAAALLLLAVLTVPYWRPGGQQTDRVAEAPRPRVVLPPPVTAHPPAPSSAKPKAAPRPTVTARVSSRPPSPPAGNHPIARTARPKVVVSAPAPTNTDAAPADDPFSRYVEVVADAMRVQGDTVRPCMVLPLQPGTPESSPCADVATVALVAELGRLDPDRAVRRLPPWPLDVEVAPDGTMSPALQDLARDTEGYLVLGRLTPCEQGVDIALYVIDGRDGAVLLNGAHPVRFDGV